MKKKRFTLKELKVKSFVTQISEAEQKTTKGGDHLFRMYPNFNFWTVEKSQFNNPNQIIRRSQKRRSEVISWNKDQTEG